MKSQGAYDRRRKRPCRTSSSAISTTSWPNASRRWPRNGSGRSMMWCCMRCVTRLGLASSNVFAETMLDPRRPDAPCAVNGTPRKRPRSRKPCRRFPARQRRRWRRPMACWATTASDQRGAGYTAPSTRGPRAPVTAGRLPGSPSRRCASEPREAGGFDDSPDRRRCTAVLASVRVRQSVRVNRPSAPRCARRRRTPARRGLPAHGARWLGDAAR